MVCGAGVISVPWPAAFSVLTSSGVSVVTKSIWSDDSACTRVTASGIERRSRFLIFAGRSALSKAVPTSCSGA